MYCIYCESTVIDIAEHWSKSCKRIPRSNKERLKYNNLYQLLKSFVKKSNTTVNMEKVKELFGNEI